MSPNKPTCIPDKVTVDLQHGGSLSVKVIQLENDKISYECPICLETFVSASSIKVHHSVKHISAEFRCQFCGFTRFPNQEVFALHQKTYHIEEEPLKCRECGRISKDKKALWRHIKETHRDRKYPCTQCGFEFTRPENLKVHVETVHGNIQPKLECKECGKIFRHRNTFRQHVRVSHREYGRLECPHCSKEFRIAQVLRTHIKHVHNKVRNAYCDVCDMKFATNCKLQRHVGSMAHKRKEERRDLNIKEESEDEEVLEKRKRTKIIRQRYNDKLKLRIKKEKEEGDEDFFAIHPEFHSVKIKKEDEDEDFVIDPQQLFKVKKEVRNADIKIEYDEDEPKKSRRTRKSKSLASQQISKCIAKMESDDTEKDKKKKAIPVKIKTTAIILKECFIKLERIADVANSQSFFIVPKIEIPEEPILSDMIEIEEPFIHIPVPADDDFMTPCWDKVLLQDEVQEQDFSHFCMYCEKGFTSLQSCSSHEIPCGQYLRSKKSFTCYQCDKVCTSRANLKLHSIVHKDDRPFICTLCPTPTTFKRACTLKSHQAHAHFGKESHWDKYKKMNRSTPCDICGKVLSTPRSQRRHKAEVHDIGTKLRANYCPFCPNYFKRRRHLQDHIEIDHISEKTWNCTLCSSVYNREWKLKQHFKRIRHLRRVALLKRGKYRKKKVKHPGSHNILLRNIPEGEEGLKTAQVVVDMILPTIKIQVHDIRVGFGKRKTMNKERLRSRPLRVFLPSVYYKNMAMKNRHKLKTYANLEVITVSKDFWCKDVKLSKGLDVSTVRR